MKLLLLILDYSWYCRPGSYQFLKIISCNGLEPHRLQSTFCLSDSTQPSQLSSGLDRWISSLNWKLLCSLLGQESWKPSHVTWFSALCSFPLAAQLLPTVTHQAPSTSPCLGSVLRALHIHIRMWSVVAFQQPPSQAMPALPLTV